METINIDDINNRIVNAILDDKLFTTSSVETPPISSFKTVGPPKNICTISDINFVRERFFHYEYPKDRTITDEDTIEKMCNFILGNNVPPEEKEFLQSYFTEEMKVRLLEKYIDSILVKSRNVYIDLNEFAKRVPFYNPRINGVPLRNYYENKGVVYNDKIELPLEKIKDILLDKGHPEGPIGVLVIRYIISNEDFFLHGWNTAHILNLKKLCCNTQWDDYEKQLLASYDELIKKDVRLKLKTHDNANNGLINDVVNSIPEELSLLEKTIYAYAKLCQVLSYDPAFFVNGTIPRNVDSVGNYNQENNNVVCHEFSYILSEILQRLGIKEINDKITILPNGQFNGHSNIKYIVDDNVVFADSTTSVIGGDLTVQKYSPQLSGIRCELYSREKQLEFYKAKARVSQYIELENADIYSMVPSKEEIESLSLKEKFILFNNSLLSCSLTNLDFISYANRLIRILGLNTNTKIMYAKNDPDRMMFRIEVATFNQHGEKENITYTIDTVDKLVYGGNDDTISFAEDLTRRTEIAL